ncbi:hypothetical protein OIU78_015741 [Salix suchowensis]|nr:hypothetical protein OIU78_015741 [Salix suchowensis]
MRKSALQAASGMPAPGLYIMNSFDVIAKVFCIPEMFFLVAWRKAMHVELIMINFQKLDEIFKYHYLIPTVLRGRWWSSERVLKLVDGAVDAQTSNNFHERVKNKVEDAGFGSRVSMVVGDGGGASSEDSWMEIWMLEFDVLIVRENDLKTILGYSQTTFTYRGSVRFQFFKNSPRDLGPITATCYKNTCKLNRSGSFPG